MADAIFVPPALFPSAPVTAVPLLAQEVGLQQEGCPLHGVRGTWGETPLTPPDPEEPDPNQPSSSPVQLRTQNILG